MYDHMKNYAKFLIYQFFEISVTKKIPKFENKKINMCIFMFIIFILIQIKFHIDINNDELLETITENNREREKKKVAKWSDFTRDNFS